MYRADGVDVAPEMEANKEQPSMLPGPALPGSCLVSFNILWAILSTSTVDLPWNDSRNTTRFRNERFCKNNRETLREVDFCFESVVRTWTGS